VYLSDVHDNPTQASNVVALPQCATDVADNALPTSEFLKP